MSEKRLDIKVAASAEGVQQTTESVRKLGEEVKKAQSGGRGPGGTPKPRSLSQQAADLGIGGDSSMVGLLRGGGAAIALGQLSSALQAVPAVVEQFRNSVASGDTRTRAFGEALVTAIPVIGNLRKGILDAVEAFEDLVTGRDRAGDEAADLAARQRETMRSKGEVDFLKKFQSANESVGEAADLLGLNKFDQMRMKNLQAFDKAQKQFKVDEDFISTFPPERQAQLKDALNKRFDAEVKIYGARQDEITKQEREAVQEQMRHYDELKMNFRQFARDTLMDWKVFFSNAGEAVKNAFRGKFLQSQKFDLDVMGMRSGLLGDLGPQFKLEAERAKVEQDIANRRADIQRRLGDPMLDQSQKTLLESMFKQLPALQREMLSNIRREEPQNRTQMESSRFLTGVGPRTAEQTQKNTAETKKYLQLIYDYLRRQQPGTTGGLIPSPF